MTMENYSNYIDQTLLKADTSREQIKKLCEQAIKYNFKSVCINPYYVKYAKSILKNTNVLVCCVVGFPLGQNTTVIKMMETKQAIDDGADEIDMVLNIAKLKENDFAYNLLEINEIKKICGSRILKVIVETCLLSIESKLNACYLVNKSNADFIKTSTGFNKFGAQVSDIVLFKSQMLPNKQIKAAGGIKTREQMVEMINAGANRIGTSSGVELIEGNLVNSDY